MHHQKQLMLQKAIFVQFYVIFIWKKTLDHWNKSSQGMGVPLEENNYADEQVVTSQDADDSEFIFKRLKEIYKEWGLLTNFNK